MQEHTGLLQNHDIRIRLLIFILLLASIMVILRTLPSLASVTTEEVKQCRRAFAHQLEWKINMAHRSIPWNELIPPSRVREWWNFSCGHGNSTGPAPRIVRIGVIIDRIKCNVEKIYFHTTSDSEHRTATINSEWQEKPNSRVRNRRFWINIVMFLLSY